MANLSKVNQLTNQVANRVTTDKASLKRFYKAQHYSAKFKGYDQAFASILESEDKQAEKLVAALIISQLTPVSQQGLLHGLVVDKQHQYQGIGAKLVGFALSFSTVKKTLPISEVICFAGQNLYHFYTKLGFEQVDEQALNPVLLQRFHAYQKYNSELNIYRYQLKLKANN